jgi:hypothetical protein
MHLNPNSPTYDYAIARHKHYALSLLRSELSSVSEPTSPMNDAIYGSAIFLAVQAIATFNTHPSSPTDLDWMPLLSGFRSFIGPMKPNISQSVFHSHMSYTRPDLPEPADERRLRQKFNLESVFVNLPATYSDHVTRLACLLDPLFLDRNYQSPPLFSLPASPIASADVPDNRISMTSLRSLLAWTATLPPSFIPRAQENDPAIIILLGWVFSIFRTIYSLQPHWWLERISKQGVEDIAKLMPDWRIHHENLP